MLVSFSDMESDCADLDCSAVRLGSRRGVAMVLALRSGFDYSL